ncbi:MAG TPA: hypothetical protein VLH19_02945 [Patescibacteria group bacterium]|nr:hypothetical protein [Patescibacteria group bacterium]
MTREAQRFQELLTIAKELYKESGREHLARFLSILSMKLDESDDNLGTITTRANVLLSNLRHVELLPVTEKKKSVLMDELEQFRKSLAVKRA